MLREVPRMVKHHPHEQTMHLPVFLVGAHCQLRLFARRQSALIAHGALHKTGTAALLMLHRAYVPRADPSPFCPYRAYYRQPDRIRKWGTVRIDDDPPRTHKNALHLSERVGLYCQSINLNQPLPKTNRGSIVDERP